jgi:hypothetical protein
MCLYAGVTGQLDNGVFSLTASNPSALTDSCGYSITPVAQQQVTLSETCTAGSAQWSSEFGTGTSSWKGQVPTSLKVVPNGVHTYSNAELVAAGYDSNCNGIVIGVTYQVLNQTGNPYQGRRTREKNTSAAGTFSDSPFEAWIGFRVELFGSDDSLLDKRRHVSIDGFRKGCTCSRDVWAIPSHALHT